MIASSSIARFFCVPALSVFALVGQADVITWTAASGGSWNAVDNWDLRRVPQNGDSVVIANTTADVTIDNDLTGLELAKLTVSGKALTLSGNAVWLTEEDAMETAPESGNVLTIALPLELAATTNVFSNTAAGTAKYTGVLSGSGALRLETTAGSVRLAAANTYAGGTYWKCAGGKTLYLDHGSALGSNRSVFILATVNDSQLYFTVEGPYDYDFAQSCQGGSLNAWLFSHCPHPKTAKITGSFVTDARGVVKTRSGGSYMGLHFTGGFRAPNASRLLVGGGYGAAFQVDGTLETTDITTPNDDSNCGQCIYFATGDNHYTALKLSVGPAVCAEANVLDPTAPIVWHNYNPDGLAWYEYYQKQFRNSSLNLLNGKGQTVAYLKSEINAGGENQSVYGSKDVTLTVRGTESAEAQCRFCEKVSIVYDATNATYCQTFKGRTHLTSGTLAVSNGTLAVTGAASWANVPKIVVADGARFELSTTLANSFSGLTELEIGEGGRFTIDATAETPFKADAPVIRLAATANITIPSGVTLGVKELWIGGVLQEGGTTYSDIPQITGGAIAPVANEPELVEATWNGTGANARFSTLANWTPAVDAAALTTGGFKPTFATAGTTAAVDGAYKVKGMVFSLPSGAETNRFAVTAENGGSLLLRDAGLSVAAPADGERNEVTLAVPTRVKGTQTWALNGSATTLAVTGPLSSTERVEVTKTGDGDLVLAADNSAFTPDWTYSGGQLWLSGGNCSLGSASTGSKATLSTTSRLVLNGTTENLPILLHGHYVGVEKAKRLQFPLAVQAGTTNELTATLTTDTTHLAVDFGDDAMLTLNGFNSDGKNVYLTGKGVMRINGDFYFPYLSPGESTVYLNCNNTFVNGGTLALTDGGKVVFERAGVLYNQSVHRIMMQAKGGTVDLNGFDQQTRFISLAPNTYGTPEIGSAKPATLSFRQSELLDGKVVTNNVVNFTGAISLVKTGNQPFAQNCGADTTGSLTVNEGAFVFTPNGSWTNGTAVAVGGTGRIVVSQSKTFNRRAVLSATDSGKFELAAGVAQKCGELWIGGLKKPYGTYGATGSGAQFVDDDHFDGKGILKAGRGGLVLVVR